LDTLGCGITNVVVLVEYRRPVLSVSFCFLNILIVPVLFSCLLIVFPWSLRQVNCFLSIMQVSKGTKMQKKSTHPADNKVW